MYYKGADQKDRKRLIIKQGCSIIYEVGMIQKMFTNKTFDHTMTICLYYGGTDVLSGQYEKWTFKNGDLDEAKLNLRKGYTVAIKGQRYSTMCWDEDIQKYVFENENIVQDIMILSHRPTFVHTNREQLFAIDELVLGKSIKQ